MGATGISWIEARDAASHPITYRIPLPPQTKTYRAQTCNNAKVEKPDLGVLALQLTLSGCALNARVDVSYRPAAPPMRLEGIMGEGPRRLGLLCLVGSTQAPFRTASNVSLRLYTLPKV